MPPPKLFVRKRITGELIEIAALTDTYTCISGQEVRDTLAVPRFGGRPLSLSEEADLVPDKAARRAR